MAAQLHLTEATVKGYVSRVLTRLGRTTTPTASIMDSQSVKNSTNIPPSTQGTDAGKRIIGRKRGILADTLDLLLAVVVTAASASDNTVGMDLLDQANTTYPTLTKAWVDAGFTPHRRNHPNLARRLKPLQPAKYVNQTFSG